MEYLEFRGVRILVTQSPGWIKVATSGETRRVSIHVIHNRVQINVGTMKKDKSKVHIGEERSIIERITLILLRPRTRGGESVPWVNDLFSRIVDKVEGTVDFWKGMKTDFSSLNNKAKSHANEINTWRATDFMCSTTGATKGNERW